MKVKVSELQGAALDWAVLVALYNKHEHGNPAHAAHFREIRGGHPLHQQAHYSSNWAHGGPIIEREAICIVQGFYRQKQNDDVRAYVCRVDSHTPTGASTIEARGSTPLVAAMRCYVASKMGDEIEIPDELAN
jgi:hypothetical protein